MNSATLACLAVFVVLGKTAWFFSPEAAARRLAGPHRDLQAVTQWARCDDVRGTKGAATSGPILYGSIWKSAVRLHTWQENCLPLTSTHEKFSHSFCFHLKVHHFTSSVPDLLRHSSCYFDVDCETVFTQSSCRGEGSHELPITRRRQRLQLVTQLRLPRRRKRDEGCTCGRGPRQALKCSMSVGERRGCFFRQADAGNQRKAGTMRWLSFLATTSRLVIHNRLHPLPEPTRKPTRAALDEKEEPRLNIERRT